MQYQCALFTIVVVPFLFLASRCVPQQQGGVEQEERGMERYVQMPFFIVCLLN